MSDRRWVNAGVCAVVGMALLGTVACQPAPAPRPVLTVNTTLGGPDANPGDGTCEMTAGTGDCSLQAAVQEGNALGTADLVVPAGRYPNNVLTITGDLKLNAGAPVDVELPDGQVQVAAGGTLTTDGLAFGPGLSDLYELTFQVDGTLVASRLLPMALSRAAIHVGPGGTATVTNSGLTAATFWDSSGVAVVNEGTLSLQNSTVHQILGGTAVTTSGAGATSMAGTLVVTDGDGCAGTAPTSGGFNYAPATCGLAGAGDQTGTNPMGADAESPYRWLPDAASPLVDAIPVGTLGCGTTLVTDQNGNPRPVEGNGSGADGCDIGGAERQLP